MTSPSTAAHIEAAAQVTIMLTMGLTAAAASFTHIHDLTVTHGQPSWIGWANAVVVELMSVAAGLELRRRKRTGQHAGFVYAVLCTAALVSLAAQVAEAEPSIRGWTVAALPALGFLAVVKIVLSRTPIPSGPDQVRHTTIEPDSPAAEQTGLPIRTDKAGPRRDLSSSATGTTRSGPIQLADLPRPSTTTARTANETTHPPHHDPEHQALTSTHPRSCLHDAAHQTRSTTTATNARTERPHSRPTKLRADPHRSRDLPAELLTVAREVAARLHQTEGKITRNGLARGIRSEGHSVSTDRASDLWRQLQTDTRLANLL